LASHELNQYGDAKGTAYLGGNPLFREETGMTIDRFDYVLRKLPRILDGFVSTLPFDGAGRAVETALAIENDFSARRLQDRIIDAALQAEQKAQALVNRIRLAIDEQNFKAIDALFAQLSGMPVTELREFGPALRDARRMLNAEFIQDLTVTRQVKDLMIALDKLESRLAA
ncbi:MAG: hypothetical protein HY814_10930, partial [Candidatus Riflebacteria bacterium]|nr:hypothetical protein [Candidatus Riflebacteria bacterium]